MKKPVRHSIAQWALAAALVLALGFASASTAQAGATQNDVLVAARALGFLEKPPTGEIAVGIVYLPANPASAADAANLQKIFGSGMKVGNVTFKPVLVNVEAIDRADVKFFFLADGLGSAVAKVATASAARKIACVTVDLDQVRSGACVMGVRSMPKIEITVNRAAAAASGTAFASVFRMMITEF